MSPSWSRTRFGTIAFTPAAGAIPGPAAGGMTGICRPLTEPAEIAGAALLLTDPAFGYLTGVILPVDGGLTAH